MSQKYSQLSDELILFIEKQKIFFVATATSDSRVNVSPKGTDSLRVVNGNRVVWLNLTGSGNETSAHIQQDSKMTLMFVAFEAKPMILRVYGNARVIHRNDAEWQEMQALFPLVPGSRQIFDIDVDLVQTSCGMSIPFFDYVEERQQLNKWAEKQGRDGLEKFWKQRNQISLDGKPTHILEKNT